MEKNGIIIFIKSVKISSFPWLKSGRLLRVRYGKKNVLGKIVGNLDFVGNSNFFRENTEAAVHECSIIISLENTRGGVLCKWTGLKPVILLLQDSATGDFLWSSIFTEHPWTAGSTEEEYSEIILIYLVKMSMLFYMLISVRALSLERIKPALKNTK